MIIINIGLVVLFNKGTTCAVLRSSGKMLRITERLITCMCERGPAMRGAESLTKRDGMLSSQNAFFGESLLRHLKLYSQIL